MLSKRHGTRCCLQPHLAVFMASLTEASLSPDCSTPWLTRLFKFSSRLCPSRGMGGIARLSCKSVLRLQTGAIRLRLAIPFTSERHIAASQGWYTNESPGHSMLERIASLIKRYTNKQRRGGLELLSRFATFNQANCKSLSCQARPA